MDVVLIPGLWLRRSIWSPVAAALSERGHRAMPVELPGVDDDRRDATLDDQLAATLAVVDACERPIVVGHSAACSLAWLVADRRPLDVAGVVLIGGFPAADRATYADFFPTIDGVMGFPGWAPFEGPDSADLDEAARRRIEADAVAVPAGVAKSVVSLGDARRFEVPVALVCPEFTPEQARAWIDAGDVPELAAAARVSMVDLDSGHWPMVSAPDALAALVDQISGDWSA